jgi:hypothetical protein
MHEVSVAGLVNAAFTSKVVTRITEYFWKFEWSYEVSIIRGVGQQESDRVTITSRSSSVELKTVVKAPPPYPEVRVPAFSEDMNIIWLFKALDENSSPTFRICRSSEKCHTPRRNPEVDEAFSYFTGFTRWSNQVASYIERRMQIEPEVNKKLDFGALRAESLFVPILPLLSEGNGTINNEPDRTDTCQIRYCLKDAQQSASELQLNLSDANRLLAEEMRALGSKQTQLCESFSNENGTTTSHEAILVTILRHSAEVSARWAETLDYVEAMLRNQLIAAIGKEVTPADFSEYMKFHNRKLFREEYAPTPFCFAIRRSEQHGPEGTVSIEETLNGGNGDTNIPSPIMTISSKSSHAQPMRFSINASTSIRFEGERHVHAWLSHRFSAQSPARLSLVSKTRQFSSMIVLVGRIASATAFEPKYAAIIQNKDELTIPLELSTIPTPKEFKDAIESLSPEQQSFAKAFRAMQLESTLFGILIIQIKPQLELVLNLPDDSLSKEIKLTQDLMQLFIKYQIPPDLLSFDGTATSTSLASVRLQKALDAVKGHVNAIQTMIDGSKNEEIQHRTQQIQYQMQQQIEEVLNRSERLDCLESKSCDLLSFSPAFSAGSGAGQGGRYCAPPAARPASFRCLTRSEAPSAPVPRLQVASTTTSGLNAPPTPKSVTHAATSSEHQGTHQCEPTEGATSSTSAAGRDYTQVPKEMDKQFQKLDTDSCLRPTIISPGQIRTKRAQKALLASPTTTSLGADLQKTEKEAAFDLLDALTKSGALAIQHASLHIVIAATHCFDKTVTETVVQDGVNPIDKVERSTLIMASTIHQEPSSKLINQNQLLRVSSTSPMLFLTDARPEEYSLLDA